MNASYCRDHHQAFWQLEPMWWDRPDNNNVAWRCTICGFIHPEGLKKPLADYGTLILTEAPDGVP